MLLSEVGPEWAEVILSTLSTAEGEPAKQLESFGSGLDMLTERIEKGMQELDAKNE